MLQNVLSRLLFLLCVGVLADAVLPVRADAAKGTWFPNYQIYPVNLADPGRPQFAAKILYVDQTNIYDTSNHIDDFQLGGRLGLYHLAAEKDNLLGWLLSLDIGFHGQFDPKRSEDLVGWDGVYSLLLSHRPNQKVAFKFGINHLSAHVGDEYAERTGRVRIGYTREELLAGMNVVVADNLQWYAEAGRAHQEGNKALQKPWRVETGLQYRPGSKPAKGWYAGVDLGATEERNWRVDTTVQVGWQIPSGSRIWRMGLEYYNGKAQLGEFFQDDKRYISMGLWVDI